MEGEELEQIKQTLINNLHSGGNFKEEEGSMQIKQKLDDLRVKIDDKIDELSKRIGKTIEDKQEYSEWKIIENPLAYMAGAFIGGVIVGYIMGRGKSCAGNYNRFA